MGGGCGGVGGALTWGAEHTGRLVAVVVLEPVKLGNGPQQRPSLPRVFPESQPQAWSCGGGITLRVPPPPAPRQALRGFQATPMLTPTLTHTWTPLSPADTLGHTHTGVRLLPAVRSCPPRPHTHTVTTTPDPRLKVTVSGCGGRGTWRGCGGRSCCPVSGRIPGLRLPGWQSPAPGVQRPGGGGGGCGQRYSA